MNRRTTDQHQIETRPDAAALVLRLCDDPGSSSDDLAGAIATDPMFTAKVLRTANSAYYGLSGRVATLQFAVSVVGFQGVRSLAVLGISGLDRPDAAPEGFWRAAAFCAVGAEMIAPMVNADSGDAFMIGLLHMMGTALMHQRGDTVAMCLPEGEAPEARDAAERARYGVSHDEVAASAMAEWHFPARIYEVVARHHLPMTPDAQPLERALHIVRSLAGEALDPSTDGDIGYAWLSEGQIGEEQRRALLSRMTRRAQDLLDGLLNLG